MSISTIRDQFTRVSSFPSSRSSRSSRPSSSSSSTRNSISSLRVPNTNSTSVPTQGVNANETDEECWSRMLALQIEYHCYNSARLEAAVQALEDGCPIEEVPRPSRLCLNLLNEALTARIRAEGGTADSK